jgi:hypothetical protein
MQLRLPLNVLIPVVGDQRNGWAKLKLGNVFVLYR